MFAESVIAPRMNDKRLQHLDVPGLIETVTSEGDHSTTRRLATTQELVAKEITAAIQRSFERRYRIAMDESALQELERIVQGPIARLEQAHQEELRRQGSRKNGGFER